jgi:hypothetical protein
MPDFYLKIEFPNTLFIIYPTLRILIDLTRFADHIRAMNPPGEDPVWMFTRLRQQYRLNY